MTVHYVDHYCGHSEKHNIQGNLEMRRDRVNYLESLDCRRCYNKRLSEGLPDMKGSERQVNWAIRIRAKMISELQVVEKMINSSFDAVPELLSLEFKKAEQIVRTEDRAKFFIDRVNYSRVDLLRNLSPDLKDILEVSYWGKITLKGF